MAGKFELYTAKNGKFRFRLKAGNGEIIAMSSEDYETKAAAKKGIASIKKNAATADLVDTDAVAAAAAKAKAAAEKAAAKAAATTVVAAGRVAPKRVVPKRVAPKRVAPKKAAPAAKAASK